MIPPSNLAITIQQQQQQQQQNNNNNERTAPPTTAAATLNLTTVHSHPLSSSSAPGDVFLPFAASARHQPRDPPQYSTPTSTTPAPTTMTTTREAQNVPRHTLHFAFPRTASSIHSRPSAATCPTHTSRVGEGHDHGLWTANG